MHGGLFFWLFTIAPVISLLMDWYLFVGLRSLAKGWPKVWRYIVTFGGLALSVTITILFIVGEGSFAHAQGMQPFHEWIFSLFLALLISKIFFCLVMLVGDIGRIAQGVYNRTTGKTSSPAPFMPSRRKFVSEVAVLVAAIPFTSFLYAMVRGKYDYKVHRETVYFDNLPEAFDGFTITQISDIHSGSFDSVEGMQKGIDLAKAQKSDLFVFTGDLVNNAAWEIEPYIDHFGSIKAPYGQFSILGNHDYGDYIDWNSDAEKDANLEQLKHNHQKLGYRLMMDENVTLEKGGQKISLIGVQNWGRHFIQKGDLNKALKGVPDDAFRILLSHDPTHWEEIVRYHPTKIHLTLAGHTHGAQFGVEAGKLRWSPVQNTYLNWAGLAAHNGRYLYVNRGFGFLGFSGRLGIWPEVTVLTLKKGSSSQSSATQLI